VSQDPARIPRPGLATHLPASPLALFVLEDLMTHLLLRLARGVLLWLLGRQPATRARRALAWTGALVACALAIEAGVIGTALAVAWWLVAHLVALLVGAGAPLALVIAALAVSRRALRRVPPPAVLAEPPAANRDPHGSSDRSLHLDVPPATPGPPGSSDTEDAPADAHDAGLTPAQRADAEPGPPEVTAPDDTFPAATLTAPPEAQDPLAAEAAWLEAHWAAEQSSNGSAPSPSAPASG
jgi:hypothetical protein